MKALRRCRRRRCCRDAAILLLLLVVLPLRSDFAARVEAFGFRVGGGVGVGGIGIGRGGGSGRGVGGGGGPRPPHDEPPSFGDGGDGDGDDDRNGMSLMGTAGGILLPRGGGEPYSAKEAVSARGGAGEQGTPEGEGGSVGPLARLTSPVRRSLQGIQRRFSSSSRGKSADGDPSHAEAMRKLRTTKITSVSAPNSTVLPDEVIAVAARRSGLLGGTLTTDRVQECARHITRWYRNKGYVLHSVTGATLHDTSSPSGGDTGEGEKEKAAKEDGGESKAPPKGRAVLTVHEPRVSASKPVDVIAAKEMVLIQPGDALHNDGGEEVGGGQQILSFRQYREKLSRRLGGDAGRRAARTLKKSDVNTTYVESRSSPRTRPSAVARALDLRPGRPFKWDPKKWRGVVSSGVFRQVLSVGPRRNPDGTVTMEVVATESPSRSLEYGISRSLYTGSWEGELDLEHSNLLGGGETAGLVVRRGASDLEPSVRLKYRDDRMGAPGGYEFEAFSDYLGSSSSGGKGVDGGLGGSIGNLKRSFRLRRRGDDGSDEADPIADPTLEGTGDSATAEKSRVEDDEVGSDNDLLDRRGVTLRFQDPLLPLCPPPPGPGGPSASSATEGGGLLSRVVPRRSDASLSAERASTLSGSREYIGSAGLGFGPVRRELGGSAGGEECGRADATVGLGWGARVVSRDDADEEEGGGTTTSGSFSSSYGLLPYFSGSVTARGIFPLFSSGGGSRAAAEGLLSDSNIVNRPSTAPLSLPSSPNAAVVPAGGATPMPVSATRSGPGSIVLALSQTLRLSTPNLPRHEANAIGFKSGVRGYHPGGGSGGKSPLSATAMPLRGSLVGTAEVRIPVRVPERMFQWLAGRGMTQDGKVVLFGDWMAGLPAYSSRDGASSSSEPTTMSDVLVRRASAGVGLRKSVQGVPVKYDVCVTADGRVGAFLGLGRDFDV